MNRFEGNMTKTFSILGTLDFLCRLEAKKICKAIVSHICALGENLNKSFELPTSHNIIVTISQQQQQHRNDFATVAKP